VFSVKGSVSWDFAVLLASEKKTMRSLSAADIQCIILLTNAHPRSYERSYISSSAAYSFFSSNLAEPLPKAPTNFWSYLLKLLKDLQWFSITFITTAKLFPSIRRSLQKFAMILGKMLSQMHQGKMMLQRLFRNFFDKICRLTPCDNLSFLIFFRFIQTNKILKY